MMLLSRSIIYYVEFYNKKRESFSFLGKESTACYMSSLAKGTGNAMKFINKLFKRHKIATYKSLIFIC